ncbi:helix-turn-helix domain-containing protein [Photobacterium leiognathi]|uniref:helix-turn-helix domain-containing protein n=1 Tax=Photobacterium leiognathi TaxID=553611 RepID=UPI002980A52E|nr:helix-turn-helix domain-containing protein [Photobacterium leiognathi]
MTTKNKSKRQYPGDMPNLNAFFSPELLGKALRSKRITLGLRVDDAAERLGLSRMTVMKIEKGNAAVTFSHVLKYIDMVGLSLQLRDLSVNVASNGHPTFACHDRHKGINHYTNLESESTEKENWLDRFNQTQRDFYSLFMTKDHMILLDRCVFVLQSNESLETKANKLKPDMLKLTMFVHEELTKSLLDKIIVKNYDTIESIVDFVLSDEFKEHYKNMTLEDFNQWQSQIGNIKTK